jgi:hypothetical protein
MFDLSICIFDFKKESPHYFPGFTPSSPNVSLHSKAFFLWHNPLFAKLHRDFGKELCPGRQAFWLFPKTLISEIS